MADKPVDGGVLAIGETVTDLVSTNLSDEDAAWLYPGEPIELVLGRLLDAGVSLGADLPDPAAIERIRRATSIERCMTAAIGTVAL